MAMSRIFSQSVCRSFLRRPTAIISHHRHRSNKTHRAELIEIEIDQASSSQADSPEASAEVITLGIKKLEDAIHSIAVRRAAPDWLPFLPGYSYWVPPRASAIRAHNPDSMIEVIGQLTSLGVARKGGLPLDMLEEEHATTKGWPSSAFFVEGTSPTYPIPVVEEEVKIQDNDDETHNTSNSKDEDEEG